MTAVSMLLRDGDRVPNETNVQIAIRAGCQFPAQEPIQNGRFIVVRPVDAR